jgi:hypothetical protein
MPRAIPSPEAVRLYLGETLLLSIQRRSLDANIAAAIGTLKNFDPERFRGYHTICG